MKKNTYITSFALSLSLVCSCAFGSKGEVTERVAEEVIKQYLTDAYTSINYEYKYDKINGKEAYDERIKSLSNLSGISIVTYIVHEDSDNYIIDVKPTKLSNSIDVENETNKFSLIAGTRELDDIEKIDGNTVYFSYYLYPNEIGRYYINGNKRKFRGKLEISYDRNVDKYNIVKLYYSVENGDWRRGSWAEERNGKTILRETSSNDKWINSASINIEGILVVLMEYHGITNEGAKLVQIVKLKTNSDEYILRLLPNTKCGDPSTNVDALSLVVTGRKDRLIVNPGTTYKVEGILLKKALTLWKNRHPTDTDDDALNAIVMDSISLESSNDSSGKTSIMQTVLLGVLYQEIFKSDLVDSENNEIILVEKLIPIQVE